MLYLDQAATSYQKPPQVYRAVWDTMTKNGASAGRGGYRAAIQSGEILFSAREKAAKLFGIENPEQIVWTQNTTQGLNMAIKGILRRGDHVIYSSMEHNSVVRPIKKEEQNGRITTSVLMGNEKGELDIAKLEKLIRPNTKLICLTHSSNVCGNITDIKRAAEIAKKRGVYILIDAAQSAGMLPIDASSFDFVAFPGHKGLMGPMGTGGLYVRKGIRLDTLTEGGTGSQSESFFQPDTMPDRLESGTMNVPGIAGLSAALDFILDVGTKQIFDHEQKLCGMFDERIGNMRGVTRYGGTHKTAISALNIKGLDCVSAANLLDEQYGICVRSGLHCAYAAHKTLGTDKTGCIRFSFGFFHTAKEVEYAADAVYALTKQFCV